MAIGRRSATRTSLSLCRAGKAVSSSHRVWKGDISEGTCLREELWIFLRNEAVVLVSGLIYFKIVAAMKLKVQTGIEGMTGGKAVVGEDLKPEGKVRFGGEIWTATGLGEKFLRGKTVKIFGFQGLRLIVGEPNRDTKR